MSAHANQATLGRPSTVLFCRAAAVEGSVDEEARTIDYIASTDDIDGHGTIVRQNWRLERFKPQGVVLYAHDDDELPIGTATCEVQDGQLRARVKFSTAALNPMAEQVWQNVKAGVIRGISPGFIPHTITCEMLDDRQVCVLDDNELYELSVTPCPSNMNAMAQMRTRALESRGAVPYKATPADDDKNWDGAAAVAQVKAWATTDGEIDWAKYRQAFAWYDETKADTEGAYKLPHHDIVDGKLVTDRAGVIAAGNALSGSRGGTSIPEGDIDAVKAHLAKHYHQFDMKAPWEQDAQKQISPPPNDGPAVTANPPIQEVRSMADKPAEPTVNIIPILRALDLPFGATEQDGIGAAVRCRRLEVGVVELTGIQNTAEALGALRAMKADADRCKTAEAELAKIKAERDAQNFEVLLAQGRTDRKLSPAEEAYQRELFARDVKDGRGEARVEELRGFLKVKAPTIPGRDIKQPEARSGAALTADGKSYKDMSFTQRAALKKSDPELFRAMKNDYEASGQP